MADQEEFQRLIQWACRKCFGEFWLFHPSEAKACPHCATKQGITRYHTDEGIARRLTLFVIPITPGADGAADQDRLAQYSHSNPDCFGETWLLTPATPNCCPHCAKILFFKGGTMPRQSNR